MNVAVVLTEVGRSIGGRFTFQEMLLESLGRLRGETRHSFITYSAGISRYTDATLAWRARRMGRVAVTLSIQASRDAQDKLIGKRLAHIRSPLQRQLDSNATDLVWFPTTRSVALESSRRCSGLRM